MNQQVIIAYCVTSELPKITEEDLKRLSSVHIAFGLINEKGEVYWDRKNTEGVLSEMRKINPGLKIVLSIGGWGADGFSQAAATEESRRKFVKSAMKILKENHLDGLDIDWEYPCSSQAGIASSEDDRENFTLLIKELRKQLDASGDGLSLSIAAGGEASYLKGTDMAEVQKYLDYVQLMTYDFHGEFKPVTGHHANLYDDAVNEEKVCADRTVRLFEEAGVPVEKMVMGAAFYGRGWIGVPPKNSGLGQIPKGGDGLHHGYADILRLQADEQAHYRYCWDDHAKAAYLYNGDSFITYEDKKALSYKADYVKKHGMHGIMFWEYSEDQTRTLVEHLYEEMNQ